MNHFPDELSNIIDILKANPRGMSVTDISQEIGVNRNTVSRYLDNLLISGQVEMKTYGKAKVFYLSQRVPISAMLNFSSDMVIVLDRGMNVIQVNDAVCGFAGSGREEILGKELRNSPLAAFDHPLIREKITSAINGEEINEELRFLRVDRELFFRFKIIPTAFNDGSPGVTLILEDITEQKYSEEALRKSEMMYRRLVEEINDVIWEVDGEYLFTFVSPRVTTVLGYHPDEMLGRSFYDFVKPGETDRVKTFFATLVHVSDAPALAEYSMLSKSGRAVALEASGSIVTDELGEFVGYRLVCRDICERTASMKRVRKWKSFLHSIVQNIPAVVLVKEMTDNTYIFFNRAAGNILDTPLREATGQRAEEIFSPDIARVIEEGDEEVRLTRQMVTRNCVNLASPDEEPSLLHLRKIPIFNQHGEHTYILTIAGNISDSLHAEDMIAGTQ